MKSGFKRCSKSIKSFRCLLYSRRGLRLRRRGAYGIHRASGPRCQGLCRKVASLRSGGRRLAVRTAMEHPIGALPRTPFPASRDFPSRGNEKIGGTGYCVTYDTDSQSRNVLASPLGEEGHEVAKGCTRVRMIMILDVDVTAERRHYNTHRPLKGKRLTTFCASLALLHPLLSLTHWIFRSLMLPYKSSSHSAKCVRCAPRGRYHNPRPERPSNLRTLRTFGAKPRQPSHRRCVHSVPFSHILQKFIFSLVLVMNRAYNKK